MKNLLIVAILTFFCISCDKNEFDIRNPDVEKFVQEIKNGTYNNYEKGENGENLWLIMPDFSEDHIQALIDFAKDTTHITAYPINPVSSITPFPGDRKYSILGECLLWTIEGIRNGSKYGSLTPYLIDTSVDESKRYNGLDGKEILIVREKFQDWWNTYKKADWKNANPLAGTTYIWH